MSMQTSTNSRGSHGATAAEGGLVSSVGASTSASEHIGALHSSTSQDQLAKSGHSQPKAGVASSPSSEAWFVPDPDQEPPSEAVILDVETPVAIDLTITPSALPSNHVLGVINPEGGADSSQASVSSSPASASVWGSAIAEIESVGHISTLSSSPISPHGANGSPEFGRRPLGSSFGRPGPASPPIHRRGSSTGADGWFTAIPKPLTSPRGHFASGEGVDPMSSPRVSSHRVQQSDPDFHFSKVSAMGSPPTASSSFSSNASSTSASVSSTISARSLEATLIGRPAPPSTFPPLGIPPPASTPPSLGSPSILSPRSATSGRPLPLTPSTASAASARDSVETTDGSSSQVSGSTSFTSRTTGITEVDSEDESDNDGDRTSSAASSSIHSSSSISSRFTAAQQASMGNMTIGSVPNTSSMALVSPRGSSGDQHGSGKTSGSPGSGPVGSGSGSVSGSGSNSTSKHGTMRPPRTKSVALNPMLVSRPSMGTMNSSAINSASSSLTSPTNAPAPIGDINGPLSPRITSTMSRGSLASGASGTTIATPSSAGSIPPHVAQIDTLDVRRTSSAQSLQSLQEIPASIAAALKIVTEGPEMQTGGDVHMLRWAWDTRKKHAFLKVSSDHSSLSWASATNYGLARSREPLRHKKTFIELAKTRGVSQLLQIGLAKSNVDFACSPEKMQFNSLKITGEWTAVWVKSSTTGDRFGVLFDLEEHKLTVYRNGMITYTHDIPKAFQVVEVPESEEVESDQPSDTSNATPQATPSAAQSTSNSNDADSTTPSDPIFPFIGVCGDQDLLITEMPEFEKYLNIVWAHERRPQLHATNETLDGVPAILEQLGLQKMRPKFEGMSVTSFQKLKDTDLRKLGATTDQRRRLMSQIESMK